MTVVAGVVFLQQLSEIVASPSPVEPDESASSPKTEKPKTIKQRIVNNSDDTTEANADEEDLEPAQPKRNDTAPVQAYSTSFLAAAAWLFYITWSLPAVGIIQHGVLTMGADRYDVTCIDWHCLSRFRFRFAGGTSNNLVHLHCLFSCVAGSNLNVRTCRYHYLPGIVVIPVAAWCATHVSVVVQRSPVTRAVIAGLLLGLLVLTTFVTRGNPTLLSICVPPFMILCDHVSGLCGDRRMATRPWTNTVSLYANGQRFRATNTGFALNNFGYWLVSILFPFLLAVHHLHPFGTVRIVPSLI